MGRLSSILVVTAVASSCCRYYHQHNNFQAEAFSPSRAATHTTTYNGISSNHKNSRLNHERIRRYPTSGATASTTQHAASAVICRAAAVPDPVIASTSLARRVIGHGVTTFLSNWKAYSMIPFVAGFVGW